jgi:hypothetical protein
LARLTVKMLDARIVPNTPQTYGLAAQHVQWRPSSTAVRPDLEAHRQLGPAVTSQPNGYGLAAQPMHGMSRPTATLRSAEATGPGQVMSSRSNGLLGVAVYPLGSTHPCQNGGACKCGGSCKGAAIRAPLLATLSSKSSVARLITSGGNGNDGGSPRVPYRPTVAPLVAGNANPCSCIGQPCDIKLPPFCQNAKTGCPCPHGKTCGRDGKCCSPDSTLPGGCGCGKGKFPNRLGGCCTKGECGLGCPCPAGQTCLNGSCTAPAPPPPVGCGKPCPNAGMPGSLACGDGVDGCGASCCPPDMICTEGFCCKPKKCDGSFCGSNGCGSSCDCELPFVCNAMNSTCECAQADEFGQPCGSSVPCSCPPGQACNTRTCIMKTSGKNLNDPVTFSKKDCTKDSDFAIWKLGSGNLVFEGSYQMVWRRHCGLKDCRSFDFDGQMRHSKSLTS